MDLVSTIHDSYEDKLDRLLRLLVSHDEKLIVLNQSMQVDLDYARRTIGVTQADFLELCERLEKDDFLDVTKDADGKLTNIRIRLVGRFFIQTEDGYKGKRRKETISTTLQSIQTWALVALTLGLLIAEGWNIYHHLTWE